MGCVGSFRVSDKPWIKDSANYKPLPSAGRGKTKNTAARLIIKELSISNAPPPCFLKRTTMAINIEIDPNEFFDYDRDFSLGEFITQEFRKQVVKDASEKLKADEFKKFSSETSAAVIGSIKDRLTDFLAEDIVLGDSWGKPKFVGSIDDLIKKRFDEILLRPVNSRGETLEGCTTNGGETWIEWMLGRRLEERINTITKRAEEKIHDAVYEAVNDKITEIKDGAIKKQVDSTFASILKGQTA